MEETIENTVIIKGVNLIEKITRRLDVIILSHILQESKVTFMIT